MRPYVGRGASRPARSSSTLWKATTQGQKISKDLAVDSQKRAKQYAWLAAISSLAVGIVVLLVLKWLAELIMWYLD